MKSSHSQTLKQLGKRVRAAREAAGLSQEGLAFEAGVDRTFISQIERGVCNPSLVTLLKVCDALKQPVNSMLKST